MGYQPGDGRGVPGATAAPRRAGVPLVQVRTGVEPDELKCKAAGDVSGPATCLGGTLPGSRRRRARGATCFVEVPEAMRGRVDGLSTTESLDMLAAIALSSAVSGRYQASARRSASDLRDLLGDLLRAVAGTAASRGCRSRRAARDRSGAGLKNVHWSPSRSRRTVAAEDRERLVATRVEHSTTMSV